MIKEIHNGTTYFLIGMSSILLFYLGIDLMILKTYSLLMYEVTVIIVLLTTAVGLARWFRYLSEHKFDSGLDNSNLRWMWK
jgi:tellurite resistance protein TehA-like permease